MRVLPAVFVLLCMLLLFAGDAAADECKDCHRKVTPGIVEQWESGKMGKHFSCDTCHGSEHRSSDDYEKAELPTPETCRKCHAEQYEQFMQGKHSLAWIAMRAMPMIAHQPTPIAGEGFKGCSGCHKIGIKPKEYLKEWSRKYGTGSCDSCHTRHKFSREEALDPRACQTCHMGFDHPQWEMWSTSKHGTVWQIESSIEGGNPERAPRCQTCHMKDGNHTVITPWGFLALRVPEDDEEWWRDRVTILQALGVLDDQGKPTQRFELVKMGRVARLSREEFEQLRAEYVETCERCHSSGFVEQHFNSCDEIVRESDRLLAEGIREVKSLYDEGILRRPADWEFAPDLLQFYEAATPIEQELYLMFLEYRMRAFQGCFHANPDYMHWYGWAEMKKSLTSIKAEARRLREEAAAQEQRGVCGPTLIALISALVVALRRSR